MVMKGELGRTVALLGLSAPLVSCALILGEGGVFDSKGTSGGKTTSGQMTAAGTGGATGDTGVTTASDMTGGPSGPSGTGGAAPTTSTSMTTASGPTPTSSTSSASTTSTSTGSGTGCQPGSVDILADDFNDSTHTLSLWSKTGAGSANVASGMLTLNGPIEFFSKKSYSIIGCQISVLLSGISGVGTPPQVHFSIKNSAGAMVAQIFVDGGPGGYISFTPANPIKNCLFDPDKHLFWRFRATSSDLFIETSGDGSTWTDEPCEATNGKGKFPLSQFGLTDGQVQVHLGTDSGQATFDSINK